MVVKMKLISRLHKYSISFISLGFISNVLIHLFYSFVRLEFTSYGFSDFLIHSELKSQYYISLFLILFGVILILVDILDSNNI